MFSIVDCCARCGICCDHLKACAKCKVTKYCSRECQSISWKGGHQFLCGKVSSLESDVNDKEYSDIDPLDYPTFERLYFETLMGSRKSWRVLLSFALPLGASVHSSPYACALVAMCFMDSSTNFIRLHEAQVLKYGNMCIDWLRKEAEKTDPNPIACFYYAHFVTESMCDDDLPLGVDDALCNHIIDLNVIGVSEGVAEACYRLGVNYDSPRSGEAVDHISAAVMYEMAATKGHPRAIDNLAKCYEQGFGVATDGYKALKLYQSTAEKGCPRSKCIVARYHEMGIGTKADLKEAVRQYIEQAEAGNMFSQYELAMCYQEGKGVKRDLRMAVEWLQRSSGQGFEKSMKFLSECYIFGKGTAVNLTKAKKWMAAAAVRGCGKSRDRLTLGVYDNHRMTWREIQALADTVV